MHRGLLTHIGVIGAYWVFGFGGSHIDGLVLINLNARKVQAVLVFLAAQGLTSFPLALSINLFCENISGASGGLRGTRALLFGVYISAPHVWKLSIVHLLATCL